MIAMAAQYLAGIWPMQEVLLPLACERINLADVMAARERPVEPGDADLIPYLAPTTEVREFLFLGSVCITRVRQREL